MRGSLLIEIHPWRGVSASSDLFVSFVVLGVVTVGVSKYTLTDRLRQMRDQLRKMVRGAGV